MGRTKQPSPPPSAAAELPKRKKKGRPSLLDIQKRLLKQQKSQSSPSDQKNPNPNNPIRTPNRRNSSPNGAYPLSDDDDERLSKKHRLLQGIDGEDPNSLTLDGREDEKCPKGTEERYGSVVELGPATPLPDQKLLAFILDRLQKKDTHGVFSEPVDPEELPDYHDIIKHPMDFGTVRKKLDDGEYSNLEQFERMVLKAAQRFISGNNYQLPTLVRNGRLTLKSVICKLPSKDIFLICSNAMEFNAPDTVFFKQARTMQDLARKDFENLRQDSDSEPQQPKVVRRGRPPGNVQRKSLEKSPLDHIGYEGLSDPTLANEDSVPWSNTYNLRREPPVKNFGPFESNGLISHRTPNSESHSNWFTEMENEFPGSVWRNVTKNGKRLTYAEEHRRESYHQQPLSRNEESPLGVFDKETKQLVMVGLQFERGYARSLARFAANLGPVAWKIASRKIQSVLPPGVGFGPGWVGENENVVKPAQVDTPKCSTSSLPSNGPPSSEQDMETMQRLRFGSNVTSPGDPRPVNASISQNLPAVPNGFIPRFADACRSSDVSRSSNFIRTHVPGEELSWQQVSRMDHKQSSVPAAIYDNNKEGHLVPGSSNPGLGQGPSQQPDLALQL